MATERAKSVETNQQQKATDEEIFDTAKVSMRKLDTITLRKIVGACIVFAETLSGLKLRPYQKPFAERIVYSLIMDDGDTVTSQFARQSGKSEATSMVLASISVMLPLFATYLAQFGIKSHLQKFERGIWIGVYAPDYERAGIIGRKVNYDLSNKTARTILTEPEIGMMFPEKLSKFTGHLPRNSYINIKSANEKVSIEGDTYHVVVTDETQEINDYILKKSISPMLASTNGTTVHIGSSYLKRVYFYDVIQLNKKEDSERSAKKQCHFEADYRVVIKYDKNYKKYIEKEKKKLGENSDEFRMSYELYWPLEKGMFITEDFLLGRLGKPYYVTNWDMKNVHVIGIDIGKTQDSTVVTVVEVDFENPIVIDKESNMIRYPKKIKNWLEIQGDDYDSQFYQICDFIDHYNWNVVVCDATGVGSPMFDRLNNKYSRKGKKVIPFIFTRQDKSYGYSLLYKELLGERLEFPNNDKAKALRKYKKFVEQMTNLSKTVESGFLVVKHTSDTGHDDYPDSLMLAVIGIEDSSERIEAEEVIDNIFRQGRNKNPLVDYAPSEKNFWNDRRN